MSSRPHSSWELHVPSAAGKDVGEERTAAPKQESSHAVGSSAGRQLREDPPNTNTTNVVTSARPMFKDQVRPSVASSRLSTPYAEATPISNSQLGNEEKLRLEKEKLELQVELERQRVELERQRAELERQRAVNQQQQQQQQQQPLVAQQPQSPLNRSTSNGRLADDSKQRSVGILVGLLILLLLVTIAGVCGSGKCTRSDTTPTSTLSTPAVPTVPVSTTTGSPRTNHPTPLPVVPTTAPAVPPTLPPVVPTTAPAVPSTIPPAPAAAPVSSPTTPTPRDSAILTLIIQRTLSGRTPRYPSFSSPEERALAWLIDEDLGTDAANELALIQRYALATLAFQTSSTVLLNGTEFVDTWVRPFVDECDWFNVNCDDTATASGQINQLILDNDNVLGNIPADLGLLTALTELDLRNNQLTGPLPASLSRLTALKLLDLSENQLTGAIPSSWQTMTALTHLDLAINELTGSIPSSLDNLIALTGLILWENRLIGTIPPSLGNITTLVEVSLRTNQLTGEIPSSLTSLSALRLLALYNNNFTGTMPFCTLETETNLTANGTLVVDCNEVFCSCCTRCCPTAGWDGIQGIVECDAR